MPVQLNIFLLLFGGLQGLLFTLFLIRKKLHKAGYAFLLIYFAVMLLQMVLKVMSKMWLFQNWKLTYLMSYELPFLYGPLVFLFARQITTNKKFRTIDTLHFAPFAISFVLIYTGQLEINTRLALQLLSIATYHFIAFKLVFPLNWLRKFIVLSAVICSVIAITIYFMYVYYPALNWLRMGFVLLSVFIYWVSFEALNQPDIFGIIHGKKKEIPKLQVHRPAKKYSNSSLPETEASRIAASLEKLMTAEKPYLDPDISIDHLAKLICSNRHHLSQVMNQKLGLSFYDYINTYRVNEAKALLSDAAHADDKIASIAYDAGFNSLSTFNDVFRKMTGQTPSQYRKQPEEAAKQQRI